MHCYHYRLNRNLTHCKTIEGVVIAKNKTEARKMVKSHIEKDDYMSTWGMPLSMIIYKPVDITEPAIIDMSRED